MPKRKEIKVGPKPNLIRRILGSPMSERTKQEWPELEAAYAGREIEMPEETARANRIINMGPFTRFMNPDAYAVTGPFGTIALNRALIEKENQDLSDILIHELSHVGQGKKGFLRNYFNPSEIENEAINREAMRKVRKGDIYLRGK